MSGWYRVFYPMFLPQLACLEAEPVLVHWGISFPVVIFTAWVPVNYRTACAVGLVNTVCTANLDFSTFLYKLGKLIIYVCPKVPKQANFAEPFKVCKLKLNYVGIVSPMLWQNYILNTGTVRYKIESQFFAVKFLCPGSSKHNFTVPVFELLHLQSP